MTVQPSSRAHVALARITRGFTGIVKLAGLISSCIQLAKAHPDHWSLAASIFMLSGGQGLEMLVLWVLRWAAGETLPRDEAPSRDTPGSMPPH